MPIKFWRLWVGRHLHIYLHTHLRLLYTMKSDHGEELFLVQVHGPPSMVQLLKKLVLKVLTRCNSNVDQEEWPCTKKWMFLVFLYMPKRAVLNKIQVWLLSCLLLGFTCLHFLLHVSKVWLANLLTIFFYEKNERVNLYMFDVIYMWHVPRVVTTLNMIFSVCLKLTLLPPYLLNTNFQFLTISIRRFARRYIEILLLSLVNFFSYPY